MKRGLCVALSLAAAIAGCVGRSSSDRDPLAAPALLITNARVRGDPEPEALWLAEGRVIALGEAALRQGAGAATLDAAGGLVLPGFHDAHVHVLSAGESLSWLALEDARSQGDVTRAVRRFGAEHPEATWIRGRGWSYDLMPRGRLPGRTALDRALAERPVLLESYDGHALWVNTRALEIAGVGPDTPDPPGGSIVRESDSRTPSGVLLDAAGALVEKALPAATRAQRLAQLDAALRHCSALGITSLDDFERDPGLFDLYAELEARGRLPLRVRVSLPLDGDLDQYTQLRQRHVSPLLGFGYLKGFVDGVVESKTAFLLAPYAGASGERGRAFLSPERLRSLVSRAHDRGFPVALHAIGDAAVRLALDTFEEVQRAQPRPELHHRIEHIEVIDPDDLPRFAALGVVASMQPFHANPLGDTPDAGAWPENLGSVRLPLTFAWRSLRAHAAPLVFGSDWPVMSADPLQGLAVAQTRRDERGRPAAGWNAHQVLDAAEALSAYAGLAGAGGLPRAGAGRIQEGLPADLVILAPGVDPEQPHSLWRGARIRAVVVGGEVRYPSAPSFPAPDPSKR